MKGTVVVHLQGDLGDQIFEYAAGLSVAKRENARLLLNVTGYKEDAQHCLELDSYGIAGEVCNRGFCFAKMYQEERGFYFETLPTNLKKRDVLQLEGYFQHWRYSEDVLPLLKEQLVLQKGLRESYQSLLEKIHNSNAVGVHIQRGDNSTFSWKESLCSVSYYTRALDWMRAKVEAPHFFVFSDDPDWVAENLAADADWTLVGRDIDSLAEDLELLRNCRHFILSASSFSWWAARLGERTGSLVLVPRLWSLLYGVKSEEFCPSHWHVLSDQDRFQAEVLEPKVSVIIPVYNVKEYLSDCIESVLDQSFQDFELLLVDDASTDGSLAIAERYEREEGRIRLLRHSENRSQGAARNTGIQAARGEYLLFVDSDDWVHPLMIEELYRELSGEEEKTIVLCSIYVQTSRYQYVKQIYQDDLLEKKNSDSNNIYFTDFNYCGPCAKLYTRDLFLPSGIRFPETCYYEDLAVLPLLFHDAVCLKIVCKPLYYYNQRQGSTLRSFLERKHFLSYAEAIAYMIGGLRSRAWEDYSLIIEYILGQMRIIFQSFLSTGMVGLAWQERLVCISEVYRRLLGIPEIALFPSRFAQLQLHCYTKIWFLTCAWFLISVWRSWLRIIVTPFVFLLRKIRVYDLLKRNHILRKMKQIVLGAEH